MRKEDGIRRAARRVGATTASTYSAVHRIRTSFDSIVLLLSNYLINIYRYPAVCGNKMQSSLFLSLSLSLFPSCRKLTEVVFSIFLSVCVRVLNLAVSVCMFMSMFMLLFSPPLTSLSTPRLTIIFSVFCCGFFARDDDDDVDVDVDDKYSLFCYLAMCARHSPSQAKVKQRSCSRAKTTSVPLPQSLLLRLRFKVNVRLALQLRRRPWQ